MIARPATLLSRSPESTWRGAVASSLRFSVPLRHGDASPESLELFARAVRADEEGSAQRPWLLFLQGGPGFPALRPTGGASGWLAELLPRFQVLLLDQRGTGGSSPIDAAALLGRGGPEAQAEYLSCFRAPDIVADAEAVRQGLGIASWSTLGQSYGGFITLSYLSLAPASLDRCLITGGLGEIRGDAAPVYRATYARMREREEEFFSWHPEDRERLQRVYDVVRAARAAGSPERLADGSEVTETTVQRLGMFLGGNGRVQGLHFALEQAVVEAPECARLSAAFLGVLQAQLDHAGHPLYWLLQESIYSSGAPTAWAASRVRAAEYPDFLPSAPCPRLLGEMALPSDYEESVPLRQLAPLAWLLAEHEGWPALYDPQALARNAVPVAAAVYTHDVYVDRELSLATAGAVRGLRVWESETLHHDGIADDPSAVIGALLELTDA
ncbi:MAG: alpha/beta hydrolase [Arthrobacter sp.]|jgi:pimeloyl-ACP methyl ester carboxylesterase|nr:alpha/beta hydrolase [Arthrobacter sp.]